MGGFAIPVSSRGLSTLLGADEPESESTGDEPVDMAAFAQFKATIIKLQQLLAVPQTGEYDDATREAVKLVQQAYSLPPTGLMDAQTKAVLEQIGADLSSMDWKFFAWMWVLQYKWGLIVGGAAVVVGGVLFWNQRKGQRR